MANKRIAIRIDKEIWQEFKRILKVVYNVNHNLFLENFIYYSNFPEIDKIIKFRGGNTYINKLSEDNTTCHITLWKSYKVKYSLENISYYLREIINLLVINPELFIYIFDITDYPIEWNMDIDTQNEFMLPFSIHKNSIFEINNLLLKDFVSIINDINTYKELIQEELDYRRFSNFRFEQMTYERYSYIEKFNNLLINIRVQIKLDKEDYHNENYSKIITLYCKKYELILIYIYKSIVMKQKRISNNLTKIRNDILKKYKRCISQIDYKISIEEFIMHILFNEYELAKFAMTGNIEINPKNIKKLNKNINFLK